ncbi:hypothetical protein [Sphingomonas sp. SRS2]|uniref:hypothetical protein n=1 Tax=Sphingomonas sp. SRS2 TaxID=133190 RepID=UPI0006986F6F|nr:hypothetical protein [Sphingomonas sp. SRS2]
MSAVAPSRQRLWSAARVLRQFDCVSLAIAAGTTEAVATAYAQLLVKSGHLVVGNPGAPAKGVPAIYRVARNEGPRAPYVSRGKIVDPNPIPTLMTRTQSTRQRIWVALRKATGAFDASTIAREAKAHNTTAADYIRQLARSGHVTIAANGNGQAGELTTYRLVRDSGPKAPVFCETSMFDPNTGRSWPTPPRREVRRRKGPATIARRPADQESAA